MTVCFTKLGAEQKVATFRQTAAISNSGLVQLSYRIYVSRSLIIQNYDGCAVATQKHYSFQPAREQSAIVTVMSS